MDLNKITGTIVDAALEVHHALGPGLLEEVYKRCLRAELLYRKLKVLSEVGLPVTYKDLSLDLGYRLDMLVEDRIIVELKAVFQLHPIHRAQFYTYLKLSNKPIGLLLNFNTRLIKDSIVRVQI